MFEEVFETRVRHVYSRCQSTDEELAFAQTLEAEAETIAIQTHGEEGDSATEVTVFTDQAVYHLYQFRTRYDGHSSRSLVELLKHFRVRLFLDFLLAHRSFTLYLTGERLVTRDAEYALTERMGSYQLVERVEWNICSSTLDTILRWSNEWDIPPETIVELAISLIQEGRGEGTPSDSKP